MTATISGWKSVQQGPVWIPVINTTEIQFGIPQDLLARMAYQESHFRPDIIAGTAASPAGALGILQLMPQFFSSVNRPLPFTQTDTLDQISEAAAELARLYGVFADWGAAVGAYNTGQGNMQKYLAGTKPLASETRSYISDVLTDVPVPTSMQV